jgi:hypothetical protein
MRGISENTKIAESAEPSRPLANIAGGPEVTGYMCANYDALGMPFGQFDQFLLNSRDQRWSMAKPLGKWHVICVTGAPMRAGTRATCSLFQRQRVNARAFPRPFDDPPTNFSAVLTRNQHASDISGIENPGWKYCSTFDYGRMINGEFEHVL